jgi:hypothetical protein
MEVMCLHNILSYCFSLCKHNYNKLCLSTTCFDVYRSSSGYCTTKWGIWLFIVFLVAAAIGVACVLNCVVCSLSVSRGFCLFLALCDFIIKNQIFYDGVVVV